MHVRYIAALSVTDKISNLLKPLKHITKLNIKKI